MKVLRGVLVAMLVCCLSLGVLACSGGSRSSEGGTGGGQNPAQADVSEPELPGGGGQNGGREVANLGDKVSSVGWDLVVKAVSRPKEAGGATAAQDKELVVIEFDITNGETSDRMIGPTSFSLRDEDKVSAEVMPTQGEEFIFNTPQPIKASENRTIKIVYQVSAGAKGLVLKFEPFATSGLEPVEVALD